MLAEALKYLKQFDQFICYKLVLNLSRSKPDKVPVNPWTGEAHNPHDPHAWMSYEIAEAMAGAARITFDGDFRVGFVHTAESKLFTLDIDGALMPDLQWHPLVSQLRAALPQAAWEVSVSGTGLHAWGRYTGSEPKHGCVSTVEGIKLELYTSGRFIALGDQISAVGNAGADCTAELHQLIASHFPPAASSSEPQAWTTEADPEWRGPQDDGELLRRAMQSRSTASAFGGKASFSDLWLANEQALGRCYPDPVRPYDASAADAALASHLAFWTGNNCQRIVQIMSRNDCGLKRDKYDREDYLPRTVMGAVGKCKSFYEGRPTVVAPVTGALTVPSGTPDELNPEDFWAHLPTHSYINRRTREFFSVEAVNGNLKRFTDQLGMKPAAWLDMFRAVQQMNWQPGHPEIIEGKVAIDGILKDDPKGRIYNLFRPSDAMASEGDASPWINHVRYLYPDEADHLFKWMAFRIQHPGRKINHAIVLGGTHGIGKDFMLEPLRYGVGVGNFEDIEYKNLFDNYSDWAERTLIVVNEARDTGGIDRYAFYESSKRLIAAPPDTLPCRKMYLGRYYVPNVMAVAITSNNKLNGLYIDPEDRRYYVAWSKAEKAPTSYFEQLWPWMLTGGGKEAALGYLRGLPIVDFNPMAPPPRTEAWHDIVDAGRNPEEKELSDALEGVKVATVKEIVAAAQFKGQLELAHTLQDRKNARKIPHLLGSIKFEPLRNPHTKDGRWVISGRRETLYADRNLPVAESITLANKRVAGGTSMAVVQ